MSATALAYVGMTWLLEPSPEGAALTHPDMQCRVFIICGLDFA